MADHSIRANVIIGIELDAPSDDEASPEAMHNGPSSSAKESIRKKKGSATPAEYTKQKNLCNRDLSPKKLDLT